MILAPATIFLVTYHSVSDPEKLAAYAKLALPAVTPFGARILARGDAAVAREHGIKERTVVVEYPSLEKAECRIRGSIEGRWGCARLSDR